MRPLVTGCFKHVSQALGAATALLLLVGCSSTPEDEASVVGPSVPPRSEQYAELPGPGLECVPYARDRSGVGIFGDAYRWWSIADGYFMRGHKPIPGAVLVLSKTARLQYGHLAVVSQILEERQILVDHANWIPGRIITGMPVLDVSPGNDWTLVKFWNRETGTFGSAYQAVGFIYNPALVASKPDKFAYFRDHL